MALPAEVAETAHRGARVSNDAFDLRLRRHLVCLAVFGCRGGPGVVEQNVWDQAIGLVVGEELRLESKRSIDSTTGVDVAALRRTVAITLPLPVLRYQTDISGVVTHTLTVKGVRRIAALRL